MHQIDSFATQSLEIRKSSIDGSGLFATKLIEARRKIGELKGEIISDIEAHKRAQGKKRLALADLGDGTTIDASKHGNEFRRINHSCKPNAYVRVCYRKVEFYSLRAIQPQEEITCNYGTTHHRGTLKCKCGSSNCRGFL